MVRWHSRKLWVLPDLLLKEWKFAWICRKDLRTSMYGPHGVRVPSHSAFSSHRLVTDARRTRREVPMFIWHATVRVCSCLQTDQEKKLERCCISIVLRRSPHACAPQTE